jgi:hypothetical protein
VQQQHVPVGERLSEALAASRIPSIREAGCDRNVSPRTRRPRKVPEQKASFQTGWHYELECPRRRRPTEIEHLHQPRQRLEALAIQALADPV